jgi:hypothetical protein
MKNVGSFPGNDAVIAEASQRLLERLSLVDIEGVMCGNQFGDQLSELPELDQAGRGVVPEVAFRQCAELHQLGVVRFQEAKIRGLHGNPPLPTAMIALFDEDWLIQRGHSNASARETPPKIPTNFSHTDVVRWHAQRSRCLLDNHCLYHVHAWLIHTASVMLDAYIFLDTNTLLHFKRPDQIDWPALLKSSAIYLVVTPTLIRELEYQKVHNRSKKLRERAKNLVGWIAKFIESNEDTQIRAGVRLHFLRQSPLIDFALHHLSHALPDDELIASAIEFRNTHSVRILITSADLGLRLKLPAHQIEGVTPPDTDKLPEELDEWEKENAELRQRLARYENRLPKLLLTFDSGKNVNPLTTIRSELLDETYAAYRPSGHPFFGPSPEHYAQCSRSGKLEAKFRVYLSVQFEIGELRNWRGQRHQN